MWSCLADVRQNAHLLLVLLAWSVLAFGGSPAVGAQSDEDLLSEFRDGPLSGVDEIVFAVRQRGKDGHWYANFGYYANSEVNETYFPPHAQNGKLVTFGEGGKLCRLNLNTGKTTTLVDDPEGGVRDPVVHYDGKKILFSYRPGKTDHYHLYEINVDGSGLRQLTDGPFDDIEPTYLPDGNIVFVSSRCKRWVKCWLTQVAVLHRCDADGQNIRAISANLEHDNTPWVLPDGRILYQRWEYVDRSQVDYHHLWTANPDGTGQMVYYGNLHPGTVMIDAKPIPATKKVVAIFSPGHGANEHDGVLTVVDPSKGPDDRSRARPSRARPSFAIRGHSRSRRSWLRTVRNSCWWTIWGRPRSSTLCLPKRRGRASSATSRGRSYARSREPWIPPRVDTDRETGTLVLVNVYQGRNMQDVKPGEIKKLLVMESLPKPINFTGGMDPLTYGGSFTLERVLGTVPVEADGSAHMELPALRSLFFVALDENDLAVKRMQSFLTVQPGEVTGCVGCHEQRTESFIPSGRLDALRRGPARSSRSPTARTCSISRATFSRSSISCASTVTATRRPRAADRMRVRSC